MNIKSKILTTCTFLSFCFTIELKAQVMDFSNIKNAKKLTITGGLNLNNLYNSYLPVNAQQYSYFINGSVNFNILGLIDIPLNINYSNRQFSYSQAYSFNQFSITPKYKWITGYFGTTAMTFSPYTLNGHQFSGVGFELVPGKWQISTMVGRLIKKTTDTTYNRMGYGLKVQFNQGKFRVGINFLHAADNPASITANQLQINGLRPQKNVVLGFEGGLMLPKIAQLDLEYSNSLIADNSGLASVSQSGVASLFFEGNGYVKSVSAIKAKLSKALFNAQTTVGLGYERVDPGYTTFGGYFFTDDFESYTVNLAQRLWGNKISFSANVGTQHDLLDTKASGQDRLVVATNLVFTPNEKFNANISFSTFKGYTYIRNLIKEVQRASSLIPIDTLNYTQINRNFSTNVSYNFIQTETKVQGISLNASVMNAANKQGEIIRQGQASLVYNAQVTYNMGWPAKKLNINVGYNYNLNAIGKNDVLVHGPTLIVQKSLLKEKLQIGLSVNALRSENRSTQSPGISSILNANFNASYGISKKSKIVTSVLLLNNSDNSNQQVATTVLPATIYTVNLGYNYQF